MQKCKNKFSNSIEFCLIWMRTKRINVRLLVVLGWDGKKEECEICCRKADNFLQQVKTESKVCGIMPMSSQVVRGGMWAGFEAVQQDYLFIVNL